MMGEGYGIPFSMFCGLMLLLPVGIVSSNDSIEQESRPIDLNNDTLKETMKEKAMSLSTSYFIQNVGQIDSDEILFYSGRGEVYFTPKGVIYRFRDMEPIQEEDTTQDDISDPMRDVPETYHEWGVVLKYSFIGANRVVPEGGNRCSWNTNYFKGSDPDRWYTEVPNYREVWYRDLWDGIDLVYRQNEKGMKYDLILKPGANPTDIQIKIEGQDSVSISDDGDLVIGTRYQDIIDSGLFTYYRDDIGVEVGCAFSLIGEDIYSFEINNHDIKKEVVIDPLLSYSTFIGGSNNDEGHGIAVDSSGKTYIIGDTYDSTTDYPTTPGAYDTTHNGIWDVFVTKLNSDGSSLLYSTFIGGSSNDEGVGITIDSSWNAYITGCTFDSPPDYPTTAGAYDTTHNGIWDVFVTKLNSDGSSLLYSTFIGGSSFDVVRGIALDPSGNAFITGYTTDSTTDYPTTPGAYDTTHNGGSDVFVTKLNSAGSSLLYSTFIGGSGSDDGFGIALDSSWNAYITGETFDDTTDYPTTAGAYDTSHSGVRDVFVTKLNSDGSSLLYSTFIGGSDLDYGWGIALDPSGNAYITGYTLSTTNYPTTAGAYDTTHNGGWDVFVTKLNSAGSALLYSTFLGGSDLDHGYGIALDLSRNAYITGYTSDGTTDYPTTPGAYDTTQNGGSDVFVTKLNSAGSSLLYSTFIGSHREDNVRGIAIDPSGNAYITGYTEDSTTDYPTTTGAYDTTHNGASDVFVTKLDFDLPVFGSDNTIVPATTGDPFTFNITVTDNTGVSSVFVEYWFSSSPSSNARMLGSGPYTYTVTIPSNLADKLHYIFHANDIADNWNQTVERNVTIIDNDAPEFIEDLTPMEGSTGDTFTFSVNVTDNINLSSVEVEYWFGDGTHDFAQMDYSVIFFYDLINPSDSVESLHYIFHANDTTDNWNQTVERIVTVMDNDAPEFIEDLTPIEGSTGDPFTFNVSVSDNIAVTGVYVEYWFGTGDKSNVSMSGTNEYSSVNNITIQNNSLDPMYYAFHVTDGSDNWVSTSEKTVTIIDNDLPIFNDDQTPSNVTVGENITFSINVTDNIGIDGVRVEYWFDEEIHHYMNMTLLESITWTFKSDIVPDASNLSYFFFAEDTSVNLIKTDVKTIQVIPFTVSINDLSASEVGTGETFEWSIEIISDETDLSVEAEYWFGTGDHSTVQLEKNDDRYNGSISIPEDSLEVLYYQIIVKNDEGKSVTSTVREVIVKDTIPPTIEPLSDVTIEAGDTVDIEIEANDNIGIDDIEWTGSPIVATGSELKGVISAEGTYPITVKVYDAAGNSNSTTFRIVVKETKNDGFHIWLFIFIAVILSLFFIGLLIFLALRKKKDIKGIDEDKTEEVVIPPEPTIPETATAGSVPSPETFETTQQLP